ncbi:MAG: AAA family ATPase [Crinalium sp.]
MLKLVINSPKGGVGKTTIATNAALLLASKGFKVLALDLAGGLRMSKYISKKQAENPSMYARIEIREAEYEELPSSGSIKGGGNKDIMIADTDDYYKIIENLFDPNRKGWRAIAPICPDDSVGLERISEELGEMATAQMITKRTIPIRILPNRCGRDNTI